MEALLIVIPLALLAGPVALGLAIYALRTIGEQRRRIQRQQEWLDQCLRRLRTLEHTPQRNAPLAVAESLAPTAEASTEPANDGEKAAAAYPAEKATDDADTAADHPAIATLASEHAEISSDSPAPTKSEPATGDVETDAASTDEPAAATPSIPSPPPASAFPPQPAPEPARPAAVTPTSTAPEARSGGWEELVGKRLLMWGGAAILFLAAALLLREAHLQGWFSSLLGAWTRPVLVFVVAAIAVPVGWRVRGRTPILGQVVMGLGVGLAQLAVWGCAEPAWLGMDEALIGTGTAFVLQVVLALGGAALSIAVDAPLVLMVALVGGYLSPLALSDGSGQRWSLFTWILLLNVVATTAAALRGWQVVHSLALVATGALVGLWCLGRETPGWDAGLVLWALGYHVLFMVGPLLRPWHRGERPAVESAAVLLGSTAGAFGLLAWLLADHRAIFGVLCVLDALLLLGLWRITVRRCGADIGVTRVAMVLVVAQIALACLVLLPVGAVAGAWLVQGLALLYLALRTRHHLLGISAHAVLLAACGRAVLLGWTAIPTSAHLWWHGRLGDLILPAVALAGAGWLWRHHRAQHPRRGRRWDQGLFAAATLSAGLGLSIDLIRHAVHLPTAWNGIGWGATLALIWTIVAHGWVRCGSWCRHGAWALVLGAAVLSSLAWSDGVIGSIPLWSWRWLLLVATLTGAWLLRHRLPPAHRLPYANGCLWWLVGLSCLELIAWGDVRGLEPMAILRLVQIPLLTGSLVAVIIARRQPICSTDSSATPPPPFATSALALASLATAASLWQMLVHIGDHVHLPLLSNPRALFVFLSVAVLMPALWTRQRTAIGVCLRDWRRWVPALVLAAVGECLTWGLTGSEAQLRTTMILTSCTCAVLSLLLCRAPAARQRIAWMISALIAASGALLIAAPEWWLLLNPRGLALVLAAVATVAVARSATSPAPWQSVPLFVAFLLLSAEPWRWAFDTYATSDDAVRMAQFLTTGWWSLLALACLPIGVIRRWRTLVRWSLGLLIVVAIKLLLIDLAGTEALLRIGACAVVGVSFLIGAWIYQRFAPRE